VLPNKDFERSKCRIAKRKPGENVTGLDLANFNISYLRRAA
jgi:hypothetical protein